MQYINRVKYLYCIHVNNYVYMLIITLYILVVICYELIITCIHINKEGNVLFNDARNTF